MQAPDQSSPGSPPSRNVIDHRRVASHGVAAIIAMILGIFTGRAWSPPADGDADLVGTVSQSLDRAQDYWARAFAPGAAPWRDARVVLIDRPEKTPCGVADRESGPFYCPANERVYLELSFLRAVDGELARRYVVAHEVGHHVQRLASGARDDRPSVEVELEADCYAGMWIRDEVERGHVGDADVNQALAEAAAVGDDRLCPSCSPEEWTHGSAAQRVAAVRRGIEGSPCK